MSAEDSHAIYGLINVAIWLAIGGGALWLISAVIKVVVDACDDFKK